MDKKCKDCKYLFFHRYLFEMLKKYHILGEMSIAEAYGRLAEWRLPSWMKPVIIQTWIDMGWIRKRDRRTITFLKCEINSVGKIYEDFKIIPKEES